MTKFPLLPMLNNSEQIITDSLTKYRRNANFMSTYMHVEIKFAFLRYCFTESVIICSELYNMGSIGKLFIFMPYFDNVPECSRLYTFSMSPQLTKHR